MAWLKPWSSYAGCAQEGPDLAQIGPLSTHSSTSTDKVHQDTIIVAMLPGVLSMRPTASHEMSSRSPLHPSILRKVGRRHRQPESAAVGPEGRGMMGGYLGCKVGGLRQGRGAGLASLLVNSGAATLNEDDIYMGDLF
jgi:hypothetical protein